MGGVQVIPYHYVSYSNTKSSEDFPNTGELGYDVPLYDGSLHMTDDMLDPSSMHIKYSSYVILCIQQILNMTDQFSWSH